MPSTVENLSCLTVEQLFREAFERAGIDPASLTIQFLTSATNITNFILNSWCARLSFSWMRSRRFMNTIPYQFYYQLPAGIKQLESVTYTNAYNPVNYQSGQAISNGHEVDVNYLFLSNNFDYVNLGKEDNIWIGWQFRIPVALSYVGLLPRYQNSFYAFSIEYSLFDNDDDEKNWTIIKTCSPDNYTIEPIKWQTIENPIYALRWRLRFRTGKSFQNKVSVEEEIELRHIFFLTMPYFMQKEKGKFINNTSMTNEAEKFQGVSGDRLLGEIAYSDWMATNQKMQTTSQPTSYFFNNRSKQPSLNLWPVPSFDNDINFNNVIRNNNELPAYVPGLLYTAYFPPKDVSDLFEGFDVPAIFVDALACELALRICEKINPGDQARMQVLIQNAQNSFNVIQNADNESQGYSFTINPDFSPIKVR